MEKLKFTIKCMVILAAFPAIMYTELTRDEKANTELKQNTVERSSAKNNNDALFSCSFFAMQAVYN
jgi:hypothetical protein